MSGIYKRPGKYVAKFLLVDDEEKGNGGQFFSENLSGAIVKDKTKGICKDYLDKKYKVLPMEFL